LRLTRKKCYDAICESEEKLEKLTKVVTVLLLTSQVTQLVWSSGEKLSEVAEISLKSFDILSVLILLSIPVARRFFFKRLRILAETAELNETAWEHRRHSLLLAGPHGHEVSCTRFLQESDLEELADMNYEAFQGTTFEAGRPKLLERNRRLFRQNPWTFLLHLDPKGSGSIIGYSCLLPLKKSGADLYSRGLLSDADLPSELITSSLDEVPAAVLIFAIALRPEWQRGGKHWSKRNEIHLFRSLRHHYAVLYRNYTVQPPPLWVQTELYGIKKKMAEFGFRLTDYLTADRDLIWELSEPMKIIPLDT